MISILVPTYNERGNIGPLVSAVEKALAQGGGMPPEHEIIVIDDNSPDGTSEEVSRLMGGVKGLSLVRRPGKAGLTGAILAGLEAARGGIIVVMDADLSHPPEAIPLLVSRLEGSDISIGSRLMEGGQVQNWPFHRKLISKGADALARILLGVRASDPLSGFFAARRVVFEKTRFRARGYKLLLNILADNPRIRVSEIPYTFRDRHAGKTKLGAKEMLAFVADLFRMKFL